MSGTCTCCHHAPSEPALVGITKTPALPAVDPRTTVAEITGRSPAATAVLKELGVNHCCGGHLSLVEAAAAAGIELEKLLEALRGALAGEPTARP